MASQEIIEFLSVFKEYLPDFDLQTAYQVRDLVLNKVVELEQKLAENQQALRKEMLEKAQELGIDIAELFQEPVKVKVKAPPKYQDPNDPTKTWSGKGKAPAWVKAALESGKTLDDLRIPTTNIDPEVGF